MISDLKFGTVVVFRGKFVSISAAFLSYQYLQSSFNTHKEIFVK